MFPGKLLNSRNELRPLQILASGPPAFREIIMARFFSDEAGELEEYQIFRQQDQPLELAYKKARVALQDAEAALREHPEDKSRQSRVAELKERLPALARQAPWLNLGYPAEYLLWGPVYG
jgi:hypothetical protein